MNHERTRNRAALLACAGALTLSCTVAYGQDRTYPIIDTNQSAYYNNTSVLGSAPLPGEAFYGQDAQYIGLQPWYQDNGDGTVTDLHTGLMWQKSPDFSTLRNWSEAMAYAESLTVGGYDDWRVPDIKELYSLIDFNGWTFGGVPFIDTDVFDFEFPDPNFGLRDMDCQYLTSTIYVGSTMGGNDTVFGVNFADGRIKGYPKDFDIMGHEFARYVRCVRGGDGSYGVNNFVENGDGTITDLATGLMWMQGDSGTEYNWQDALAYAENLSFAGHDDWQLPDAKQLQSIVDYTRAPDASDPGQQGTAIDPIFNVTETESYFWSGTTHLDMPTPEQAVYVCFGQAWGYMGNPPFGEWQNVHGAGAQRSDPKDGDPNDYPYGRGPQGDDVRIFNYVRCVRPAGTTLSVSPMPLVADQTGQFSVSDALPNQSAWLVYGLRGSGATHVASLNTTIDLAGPKLAGSALTVGADGTAQWNLRVPAAGSGQSVSVQAIQAGNKSNVVSTQVQ
ncbi:MAG: DUF1566 domain-containing protein [Planctomycetes bacterium]|nr:DUF1566 domain-containing protein [Planctomycetota bacterium]NOG53059.1 DUF1566 domain-containing protein [Planctomycetota bacterium]